VVLEREAKGWHEQVQELTADNERLRACGEILAARDARVWNEAIKAAAKIANEMSDFRSHEHEGQEFRSERSAPQMRAVIESCIRKLVRK
jgi:hypothetical protein